MTAPERTANAFLTELFGLTGKVAVVTGAGSGIGHGIARYLAAAGAEVVIADLNLEAAARVADELNAARPESALALRTDVSDEASVEATMRAALERFGRIDVLVNDAGIFPTTPIAEMTLHDWERGKRPLKAVLTTSWPCVEPAIGSTPEVLPSRRCR